MVITNYKTDNVDFNKIVIFIFKIDRVVWIIPKPYCFDIPCSLGLYFYNFRSDRTASEHNGLADRNKNEFPRFSSPCLNKSDVQ